MVNLCDPVFVQDFASLILDKEQSIISEFKSLGSAAGTDLPIDSLTAKYRFYNIFAWRDPISMSFTNFVVTQYKQFLDHFELATPQTWARCWANVLRPGESIARHNHGCDSYSYLSGHFVLAAENTATYYENPMDLTVHQEPNTPGSLTLFPSYIRHWTDTNTSLKPRITLAFDLFIANEEFRKSNHYGYFRGLHDAPEVQIC